MLPLPVSVNKVKNDDKPDKHPKKRPDANSQQQDTAAAHVEKVRRPRDLERAKTRESGSSGFEGHAFENPRKGTRSVLDSISTSVLWEQHVPENMYARFPGAMDRTPKRAPMTGARFSFTEFK